MDGPLLKVADVARLLSAHPQSIYKIAHRIPGCKKIAGIGLRFDRFKLEEWLERQQISRASR